MAEETALQRTARYFRATVAFYKRECQPRVIRFYKFIKQKYQQYKQYRDTQKQIAKGRAAQEAEAIRKRQAEIEEEQAAAARAAYHPEAAVEDMRLAHSYLEDWTEKKGHYHVLGLAADYIEQARTKDPNAKLTIEIEKGPNKGESETHTLDDLSGIALFYESQRYSRRDASPGELQQARDLLTRAIAYRPYSVQIREHLAKVYLNLHDKPSALAVAEEAVSKAPKDLDARKLRDYVQGAPITHAPTIFESNPGCIFPSIGGGIVIFAILSAIVGQFSTAFGLGVIAFIVFGIGHFVDNSQMLKKALEKQARDQADKR